MANNGQSVVVFDTNFLSLALRPDLAKAPTVAGKAIERYTDRIERLILDLEDEPAVIGLPTPVLGELFVLLGAEASVRFIEFIQDSTAHRVLPLDEFGALDAAECHRRAFESTGNKRGDSGDYWQKIKVDRQIAGVAKSNGVVRVYTTDFGVRKECQRLDVESVMLHELPLPEAHQPLLTGLELEAAEGAEEG